MQKRGIEGFRDGTSHREDRVKDGNESGGVNVGANGGLVVMVTDSHPRSHRVLCKNAISIKPVKRKYCITNIIYNSLSRSLPSHFLLYVLVTVMAQRELDSK